MNQALDLDLLRSRTQREEEAASHLSARNREDLHTRHMNATMVRMLRTIGYDVDFASGRGPYLFDRAGARYLDLLSGWGVFGIGRNHPRLRSVLASVLESELPNLLQMGVSTLSGILAARLLRYAPHLDKVHFANSGSGAVEVALKFARRATGRPRLVYCSGGFHGLTYGALSVNGERVFREGFGPLLPDCVRIPFDDLAALEQALSSRQAAAFIVEPIPGHGVHVPRDDYLPGAQRLCRKYGTLFIADEVQTGLGRTGRFLAVDHWNVEPDMVLLSKTLSGGHVPVSAVLLRKWIHEKTFDRMDHAVIQGSTFAMNDLAMAAGIATLEVIEAEGLVGNAAQLGERLLRSFADMAPRYEMIREVRGKGLMIGIEFGRPDSLQLRAAWHALETLSTGLFCQLISIPLLKQHRILAQVAGYASHTVKLLPALVISGEDCDWIERAFEDVIAQAHRGPGVVWTLGKTLAGHMLKARGPTQPQSS